MSLALVMTWEMRRLLTPDRVAMLLFRRCGFAGRNCRFENIFLVYLADKDSVLNEDYVQASVTRNESIDSTISCSMLWRIRMEVLQAHHRGFSLGEARTSPCRIDVMGNKYSKDLESRDMRGRKKHAGGDVLEVVQHASAAMLMQATAPQ